LRCATTAPLSNESVIGYLLAECLTEHYAVHGTVFTGSNKADIDSLTLVFPTICQAIAPSVTGCPYSSPQF